MGRNELDDLSIDRRRLKLCLYRSWRHMGYGGIAPFILNLGTTWRRMVSFTPKSLYPLERTPVSIE